MDINCSSNKTFVRSGSSFYAKKQDSSDPVVKKLATFQYINGYMRNSQLFKERWSIGEVEKFMAPALEKMSPQQPPKTTVIFPESKQKHN